MHQPRRNIHPSNSHKARRARAAATAASAAVQPGLSVPPWQALSAGALAAALVFQTTEAQSPPLPTVPAPTAVAAPAPPPVSIPVVSALPVTGTPTALAASNAQGNTARLNSRPGEPVLLSFNAAEIGDMARAIAAATGRTIVVDPRVKGQMTLNSERRIPALQAFNQFAAQLRLQGFALIEQAGIWKVVPEADAKVQGGAVSIAGGPAPVVSNQIVTEIFKLTHETANNLVPSLRPLISANNTLTVNPASNALIITDYADNLQRIAKVIAALDVANATDMDVVPLKHVVAQDVAGIVLRFTENAGGTAAGQGQVDNAYRTTIIPEPRSNSLIVRAANPARLSFVRQVIAKLDVPSGNVNTGNIYVVPLKNADATKVATTLRAAMGASAAPAAAAPSAPGQNAPASAATTGGQVQADVASNSLIITASEPQYRQLRGVIDRLDERRAQVFVESLIAEVSSDRAAEFGIQWQGALGNKGDKNIGLMGTNFGSGGTNIINLAVQGANGSVAPAKGLNLGLARNTDGVYVLGFLARFLESSGDGNVLSAPQLLTLDNEEAKIVIGQNVPFVTGQFTNTGSSGGNVNPFQTIERRDVGLTLRVKPQISENGSIKLAVFNEISSVDPASRSAATGLITNKRSFESNVVVQDGGIVVLGGLLQEEYSGGQEKIPGVSEVPVFGNLFKSETRNRKKTNLMVFLRPVVVRDGQTTEKYSLDRYDLMRAGQIESQPAPSAVTPVNEAPVLPPMRAPASAPATSPAASSPAAPAPVTK